MQYNAIIQRRGEKITATVLLQFALETLAFIYHHEVEMLQRLESQQLLSQKRSNAQTQIQPAKPRLSVRQLLALREYLPGASSKFDDNEQNRGSQTGSKMQSQSDEIEQQLTPQRHQILTQVAQLYSKFNSVDRIIELSQYGIPKSNE
jgi:hypothetical protein